MTNPFLRLKKIIQRTSRADHSEQRRIIAIDTYKRLFLEYRACTNLCTDATNDVIVSLTSYGDKIWNSYLTIESLFHQTVKPTRIILWLDKTKFSNKSNIPNALLEQTRRGLEIRLCKDVRSHTKLIPALEEFPDSPIITVDDDIIYPIDFIEKLLKKYVADNTKIYFYRGHQITFNQSDFSRPGKYLDWVAKGASGSSLLNVPTGVLGVIYPPHCFHKDICDDSIFLDLCPYADDIWFKVMSLLNSVECEEINTIHRENQFISLDIDESTSLQSKNVTCGLNDMQIHRLFKYYNLADLFAKLDKEGKL